MSAPLADRFEDIRTRLAEIRLDEVPRCPVVPSKFLRDCLREVVKCAEGCPFAGDWIGPQEDG